MSGPLQGVVILDFTQLVQGPFATQILGDMGAEIIKVEPPKGDWLRHFALDNVHLAGESVSFLGFNRNKRSLAIDLKNPQEVEIVRRLVEKVDVDGELPPRRDGLAGPGLRLSPRSVPG
jgi:crotonobetainyl-CoA:carnitine CoA-transferase CaiB-like acyl-CoA transferase